MMDRADPEARPVAELAAELENYRHAFDTTAIDRDRLAKGLATYRHAFETTAADRDIIRHDRDFLNSVIEGLIAKPSVLEILTRAQALPPAPVRFQTRSPAMTRSRHLLLKENSYC
jgi:hypothetical protein